MWTQRKNESLKKLEAEEKKSMHCGETREEGVLRVAEKKRGLMGATTQRGKRSLLEGKRLRRARGEKIF